MIICNAHITSFTTMTGTLGTGEPAFSAEMVAVSRPIPVRMSDPTESQRRRHQAEDIEIIRTIECSPRALAARSITPKSGDRLSARYSGKADAIKLVVVEVLSSETAGLAGALEQTRLLCRRVHA